MCPRREDAALRGFGGLVGGLSRTLAMMEWGRWIGALPVAVDIVKLCTLRWAGLGGFVFCVVFGRVGRVDASRLSLRSFGVGLARLDSSGNVNSGSRRDRYAKYAAHRDKQPDFWSTCLLRATHPLPSPWSGRSFEPGWISAR